MQPDARIVTTYAPSSWDKFFRKNLESWLEFLDCEIVVYHERTRPEFEHGTQTQRVVWRQWEEIPGAVPFVTEARQFMAACGQFGGRYDYNYDVNKFCRKVFAQCDAAAEHTDYLIWLDSDVEVKRPFGVMLLEELLCGMPMALYQRPGFHTETGVVIWDMRQKHCTEFFRAYRAIHDNRRVYCVPGGWHDCWTLDYLVAQLGIPIANLTAGGRDFKSPHAHLEVVTGSPLGQYLTHAKGPAKHAA